ncbi:hypothetical protein HPP92_018393 [Vanilla planifolia]|uniref:Uncharacterized protein n=1 Tax=Vanilla planifolia TaxID=51239 RepID=A0A835Q8Q2_VANPL|nr:hypothetical protein HPP92_018393 [Vanilla planifolia]
MSVENSADRPRSPGSKECSVSSSTAGKPAASPQDEIRAVARKFADQPLSNPEPGVWAVLTAITKVARLRPQVSPTMHSQVIPFRKTVTLALKPGPFAATTPVVRS